MNPPKFHGNIHPILTEEWLKDISRCFHILDTPREYQVTFVCNKLKKNANYQQYMLEMNLGDDNMTQEEFEMAFKDQYLDKEIKNEITKKFDTV